MCLSLQRPGAQRDFVWWEEVSGLSLAGDVSADFALAIFFIVVRERGREGGEREGERDRDREKESQTLVFIWAAGATRLGQTPSVWVTRVLSK